MKVRMASVVIGAELIGRMIRKKIRQCPAPSSLRRLLDLLVDAEEELPQEEDRERRHEEATAGPCRGRC